MDGTQNRSTAFAVLLPFVTDVGNVLISIVAVMGGIEGGCGVGGGDDGEF